MPHYKKNKNIFPRACMRNRNVGGFSLNVGWEGGDRGYFCPRDSRGCGPKTTLRYFLPLQVISSFFFFFSHALEISEKGSEGEGGRAGAMFYCCCCTIEPVGLLACEGPRGWEHIHAVPACPWC